MALARDDYHTRGVAATQRRMHFAEQVEMRQMICLCHTVMYYCTVYRLNTVNYSTAQYIKGKHIYK